LAEPLISFSHVPSWYFGITKSCLNDRSHLFPNLWALWGDEVNAFVVSDHCIAIVGNCGLIQIYKGVSQVFGCSLVISMLLWVSVLPSDFQQDFYAD